MNLPWCWRFISSGIDSAVEHFFHMTNENRLRVKAWPWDFNWRSFKRRSWLFLPSPMNSAICASCGVVPNKSLHVLFRMLSSKAAIYAGFKKQGSSLGFVKKLKAHFRSHNEIELAIAHASQSVTVITAPATTLHLSAALNDLCVFNFAGREN